MSFKLTVGKVAFLDVDAFYNEAIIGIYPIEGVSKHYLFYFMPLFAQYGETNAAIEGATLNSQSLSSLPIPLPP
jgi:type I restriction enzyme S subunit